MIYLVYIHIVGQRWKRRRSYPVSVSCEHLPYYWLDGSNCTVLWDWVRNFKVIFLICLVFRILSFHKNIERTFHFFFFLFLFLDFFAYIWYMAFCIDVSDDICQITDTSIELWIQMKKIKTHIFKLWRMFSFWNIKSYFKLNANNYFELAINCSSK